MIGLSCWVTRSDDLICRLEERSLGNTERCFLHTAYLPLTKRFFINILRLEQYNVVFMFIAINMATCRGACSGAVRTMQKQQTPDCSRRVQGDVAIMPPSHSAHSPPVYGTSSRFHILFPASIIAYCIRIRQRPMNFT